MSQLIGKSALVTGAGAGIGRAVALGLAKAGAEVAVNDLSAADAEATARLIREAGGQATAHPADVGDEAAVDALFGALPRLDILVCNAGVTRAEDIFEMSLASWNEVLRVNLTGAFLCCRRAFGIMRAQGQGGAIVMMSSVVAHQGALKGHAHYAASKAGLIGLAKTLARTGAPLGVTVNCVAPGIVETDLLFRTHGEAGVEALKERVPLASLVKPEDVAEAVVYLAAARQITGAVLDVNGGMLMR